MTQIAAAPTFTAEQLGPRCLVVGGAGYIGRRIVKRLLEHGCQVRCFDMNSTDLGPDVEFIAGDLRDYKAIGDACRDIDTVFHTAALINLLGTYRPAVRRLVYDVNVAGTRNVVRAAQAAGVKALVLTSTFNVALDGPCKQLDESTPYVDGARDLYSATKIEAERCVLAADTAAGLRTCALRPGGVWGPDTNSIMIRNFLTSLKAGKFKMLIGNGKVAMDNTHVENLVDAQLLAARGLLESPDTVGGEAFFINDDEPVNGLEWFRPLVEALGEKFPSVRLPAGLMRPLARAMELAHFFGAPEPDLTLRGIRNLTEDANFRIDKARERLGYAPRYQRENGIPELVPAAREFLQQGAAAA